MIGDVITIKPEYYRTTDVLFEDIKARLHDNNKQKYVILIAGESGSGKSVTAICLQKALQSLGKVAILHLDDYFKLPPATNHAAREQDITWVGANEVQLTLLQRHVDAFLTHKTYVVKPLVNYTANQIEKERMYFKAVNFLIVEGTYSFWLENADYHVFMERNYKDTYQQRMERGRDIQTDFVEQVLQIEHELISPTKHKANAIVKKDYSVKLVNELMISE